MIYHHGPKIPYGHKHNKSSSKSYLNEGEAYIVLITALLHTHVVVSLLELVSKLQVVMRLSPGSKSALSYGIGWTGWKLKSQYCRCARGLSSVPLRKCRVLIVDPIWGVKGKGEDGRNVKNRLSLDVYTNWTKSPDACEAVYRPS